MSKEVAEIYVLKSLFGMTRQATESRTSFMGKRGSLYVVVVKKKKMHVLLFWKFVVLLVTVNALRETSFHYITALLPVLYLLRYEKLVASECYL